MILSNKKKIIILKASDLLILVGILTNGKNCFKTATFIWENTSLTFLGEKG